MPIFNIKNKKLSELKSETPSERELQELVDENLYEIFGLNFIKREFGGQGLFIDTIAYDPETKAPVLIEYKKDTHQSVVDQGMAYLYWLLTHKEGYQLALQQKLGRNEVDWSQAKVIFIAKRFNLHQIYASGFKNVPFELYRYDLCGNVFLIEAVEIPRSDVSITSILKTKEVKKVAQQVKTYTIEDHLKKANEKTRVLFEKLHKLILSLDERIQAKPVMSYIGYKIRWFNFCCILFYKDSLKVVVLKEEKKAKEDIDDPKGLFKKTGTRGWYTDINHDKDIEYVLSIIKQGYENAPDL